MQRFAGPGLPSTVFQKGFNQTFGNFNSGNNISTAPDEIAVITGQTDNYDVKIEQVIDQHETVEVICTHGPICTQEEFEYGVIYMLGLMGSVPITTKHLNKIQAKDRELYESVLEQYYNVLRRVTVSGVISEKIIYKP